MSTIAAIKIHLLVIGIVCISIRAADGLELFATPNANFLIVCSVERPDGDAQCSSTLADIGARDLASDPAASDGIWAITRDVFTANTVELVHLDPFSMTIESRVEVLSDELVGTLAIDPTDGKFYGTTTDSLVLIDEVTGEIEVVGPTNFPISEGLAFDASGGLFGTTRGIPGRLLRLNKENGNASTVGILDGVIRDMAFDPLEQTMYGIGSVDDVYQLVRIDTDSAMTTKLGPSLLRPSGLAFANVPEPSAPILLVCMILFMTQRLR